MVFRTTKAPDSRVPLPGIGGPGGGGGGRGLGFWIFVLVLLAAVGTALTKMIG